MGPKSEIGDFLVVGWYRFAARGHRRWTRAMLKAYRLANFHPPTQKRPGRIYLDDAIKTLWPINSKMRKLYERDGLACCWCGQTCDPRAKPNSPKFPTKEHVIRLADGGKDSLDNLKIACRKCNNSRHHWPKTEATLPES